jgi:outer membrane protein
MRQVARGLLLASAVFFPARAQAEAVQGSCAEGFCTVQLTSAQMLAKASDLVAQHQFDEARPLLLALTNVPGIAPDLHFLAGYIAIESGDTQAAVNHFRAALAVNPKQTRVRLELARALMLQGKKGAADYNFRLAEQDANLPPEIEATIRASRGLLRDTREWHLNTNFGFAPDSNITNGTDAQSVGVNLGNNQIIPLTLDANARRRSGIGQTGSVSGGWRGRLGESWAMLADVDAQGTNYSGTEVDDFTGQIALGPELKLSDATLLSIQGIGSQRWFGGKRASTQFGSRVAVQSTLDAGQRIGLSLDARHTTSAINADYTGWNVGAYATYERVMMRSMVASISVFGRADTLASKAYSSREAGFSLGIGGELKHGINAGISGGVSRAVYDAPLISFASEPRKDWRVNARVYVGIRSIRVLGFSPSVSYSYSRNGASLPLYQSERSRFIFDLARYF